MSGEAGAGAISDYFQIFFSSGMTVSVAMPPDVEENPNYISDYFKEADKPFQQQLEQVLPLLNRKVKELIEQLDLPIIPYDPKARVVAGVIKEDTHEFEDNEHDKNFAKNWFSNSKDPKAFISVQFFTKSFSKITLSFTVEQRILRSQLNRLRDEILLLF